VEGECFNVQFANDQAKIFFLFTVPLKDLLGMWKDTGSSSGSKKKKEPFFLRYYTSPSCNVYVQRLELFHLRRACEFLSNILWSVLEQHAKGSHRNIA